MMDTVTRVDTVRLETGPKATINVVASMIWRPFDSRLSDLLERLAFQQQIVRDELNLAQARAINHLVEAQKQENKLQERRAEAEKRARVLLDEIKSLSQDMVRSMEQRHEGISLFSVESSILKRPALLTSHHVLALCRRDCVPDSGMVVPLIFCRGVRGVSRFRQGRYRTLVLRGPQFHAVAPTP